MISNYIVQRGIKDYITGSISCIVGSFDETKTYTGSPELLDTLRIHISNFRNKTPILVEAGVIRGSNYAYVVDTMRKYFGMDKKIITMALYENIHSNCVISRSRIEKNNYQLFRKCR